MDYFINMLNMTVLQFHSIMMILIIILHIFIAAGVARDIGMMNKRQLPPLVLPGSVWVLAALITGIWGLLVYWLMHHSSLAR